MNTFANKLQFKDAGFIRAHTLEIKGAGRLERIKCVFLDRLSRLHFKSKPRQILGSYWKSFVDIHYQIL